MRKSNAEWNEKSRKVEDMNVHSKRCTPLYSVHADKVQCTQIVLHLHQYLLHLHLHQSDNDNREDDDCDVIAQLEESFRCF